MIAVGIFLFIAVTMVIVLLVAMPGMKEGHIGTQHYDVAVNNYTKDIVLSPKKADGEIPAADHKYTLIWLHGQDSSALEAAKMFADQKDDLRITPDTTKIIIPHAPKKPEPYKAPTLTDEEIEKISKDAVEAKAKYDALT